MANGILYICATPIGNLSDVSERLLTTLRDVAYILCEDTRVTRTLLQRYDIQTKMVSCNHHQEAHKVDWIVDEINAGKSFALVSDAGTPGICDPGYTVVSAVRAAGKAIQVIPGPSALAALLSIAGMPLDRFFFSGFVPKRVRDWHRDCDWARTAHVPIVFFETPHRIHATLDWLKVFDAEAHMILGKELTKHFETIVEGTPEQISKTPSLASPRGEWCGVVQFSAVTEAPAAPIVAELKSIGLSDRHIVDVASKILHINKNEVYRLLLASSEKGTRRD